MSKARVGVCRVVEVFGATKEEIETSVKYVEERIKALLDKPAHVLSFVKEEYDEELEETYWYGIVTFDYFLDKWVELEEVDPANGVAILEVK